MRSTANKTRRYRLSKVCSDDVPRAGGSFALKVVNVPPSTRNNIRGAKGSLTPSEPMP